MARSGKVLPNCIKKPSQPVAWPPQGGTRRPVKRGEMWQDVATSAGTSVTALLQFNFGTTNPREINWYLENYVRCTRTTDNRKNYLFDNDLSVYVKPRVQIDEVQLEILADMGYDADMAAKIAGGVRLGTGVVGTGLTFATWFSASAGLAAGSAVVSLFGALMVPVASLAAIAAIKEKSPKIMAQVAQAYTKMRWVYGDANVTAPLPDKFLNRRFPHIESLPYGDSTNKNLREERARYVQAWQAGATAMEQKMKEGFEKSYRLYLKNAKKNGNTPRSKQDVMNVVRQMEQKRAAAKSRTQYLNSIWNEMKKAEPISGQPGMLPATAQSFNWRF